MGSQQSNFDPGFQGHQRLGLIKVAPNHALDLQKVEEDSKQIMILAQRLATESQLKEWNEPIKKYKLVDIKDYLLLPLKTQIQHKGFCGSSTRIDLVYPSYTHVLRQQINDRFKMERRMYDESEIWYLLYNLVCVGRYFEALGVKIGNVHTSNILFNSEGWMKVISQYSIPGQLTNFNKICQTQLEDVFLAPEEIDHDYINKNVYPPKINPNRAELFSIGMTVLEAATLQLSTLTYDKGPYRVNFAKVKQNLMLLKYKYSTNLYKIVESLLAENPNHRKTCRELFQILEPYQDEILALDPFQFEPKRANIQESLQYSKSSGFNASNIMNGVNQSRSELMETQIISPSNHSSSNFINNTTSRPIPINQPRERLPSLGSSPIQFFSPRPHNVIYKNN